MNQKRLAIAGMTGAFPVAIGIGDLGVGSNFRFHLVVDLVIIAIDVLVLQHHG